MKAYRTCIIRQEWGVHEVPSGGHVINMETYDLPGRAAHAREANTSPAPHQHIAKERA